MLVLLVVWVVVWVCSFRCVHWCWCRRLCRTCRARVWRCAGWWSAVGCVVRSVCRAEIEGGLLGDGCCCCCCSCFWCSAAIALVAWSGVSWFDMFCDAVVESDCRGFLPDFFFVAGSRRSPFVWWVFCVFSPRSLSSHVNFLGGIQCWSSRPRLFIWIRIALLR